MPSVFSLFSVVAFAAAYYMNRHGDKDGLYIVPLADRL